MIGLFTQDSLAPHDNCLVWTPFLTWLHAISDVSIGVAYYAIPLAIAVLVVRHKDLAFGWIFWLFALFIFASGTTRLMEVWVLWHPDYGLLGLLKAFTALVAVVTACLLWLMVPRLLAIPTPTQYRRVSDLLVTETARHGQTVRQLHRTEESFRLLVESVRDHALFMMDRDGIVTSWNSGAERIKGYKAGDILGRHFSVFYQQDEQAAGVPADALETALRDGQFQAEGQRVRKDGTTFTADVVINPILDLDGVHVGFAKITRDITDHKRAEESLEQAKAALIQAQKMEAVGQLTGGIAHDFNNMLTAILGSLELLETRKETFNQSTLRLLGVMRKSATHGAELTRRLLAFSRKQMLAPAVTDVNRLVSGLSEMLGGILGESISIGTTLAAGIRPVFIDRNQLESTLLNLAVNARDAMQSGGALTIETSDVFLDGEYARRRNEVSVGDYVMIAVSDTGTGMTDEVRNRAIEPFYSTKNVGQGTGLGLSQVYGFIKQSGGHVEIYSEPGIGTTIKLYLPHHHAIVTALPAGGPDQAEPVPTGSELILVVEDDAAVRGYSVDALRHLGYTTLEADSAGPAMELIRANPEIRLLFTDVGLPGKNGRQLATEATRLRPDMKVVYTTGYARNAIIKHGLLERGVHLLPKPFTVDRLARILRSVLDDT